MLQIRRHALCLILVAAGVLALNPIPVKAETNSALGGIGGLNNGTVQYGDGSGAAQITLNIVDLALVKQARDLSGTLLPNGADVYPGQEIYFLLYIENPTSFPAENVQISDQLREDQFQYIPDSMEMSFISAGSGDAQIWSGSWATLTDVVGGPDDGASVMDRGGPSGLDNISVGSVAGQINQPVAIPANSILAIRFRVRVL